MPVDSIYSCQIFSHNQDDAPYASQLVIW